MIEKKLIAALRAAQIPHKFEEPEFLELEDAAIKILDHPLDLHIQLTTYGPMPFSLNWWTDTRKIAMNMIEYKNIADLMLAIKELTTTKK